jgi:hypothetical protein
MPGWAENGLGVQIVSSLGEFLVARRKKSATIGRSSEGKEQIKLSLQAVAVPRVVGAEPI